MTKLWNYLKKKSKTLHELAKEFPEKTYRDLEKYRDADRREEAQQIITEQENEELKENQHKEDWKKRAEEAEGELSILKGIGNTSPEMRDAKEKIKELPLISMANSLQAVSAISINNNSIIRIIYFSC